MLVADERAHERMALLRADLERACRHIEWLLPFLSAKAKESGNVAGLQMNAQQVVKEARRRMNAFDVEDKIAADQLAGVTK